MFFFVFLIDQVRNEVICIVSTCI